MELHDGAVRSAGDVQYDANDAVPGLLWDAGVTIAAAVAELIPADYVPHPASRSFLEVAAGIALPSLAALARGFEVVTTDLLPQPWLQSVRLNRLDETRWAGVSLDALDRASWAAFGDRRFDVIATGLNLYNDDEIRVGAAFLALLDHFLRPGGVALYTDSDSSRPRPGAGGMTWRAKLLTIFQHHAAAVETYERNVAGRWRLVGPDDAFDPEGCRVAVFRAAALAPPLATNDARKVFDAIDTDGSGAIDFEEFRANLAKGGVGAAGLMPVC